MDFKWDYDGMGAFLRTSPDLEEALLQAAEHGAEVARRIAPVGTPPDDEHPGEYRDSIVAEPSEAIKGDRLASRVVARSDHAAAVEWGNKRSPAHHTLLHALGLMGEG